jgi:hypothetical protein
LLGGLSGHLDHFLLAGSLPGQERWYGVPSGDFVVVLTRCVRRADRLCVAQLLLCCNGGAVLPRGGILAEENSTFLLLTVGFLLTANLISATDLLVHVLLYWSALYGGLVGAYIASWRRQAMGSIQRTMGTGQRMAGYPQLWPKLVFLLSCTFHHPTSLPIAKLTQLNRHKVWPMCFLLFPCWLW